jgi:hypothetical protein
MSAKTKGKVSRAKKDKAKKPVFLLEIPITQSKGTLKITRSSVPVSTPQRRQRLKASRTRRSSLFSRSACWQQQRASKQLALPLQPRLSRGVGPHTY